MRRSFYVSLISHTKTSIFEENKKRKQSGAVLWQKKFFLFLRL
jgi:hypothetical protein